jgi:anti-sigma factor RsiW
MTVHLDVETLSTYLDHELSHPRQGQVEEHLEHCDECQERLSNLRKVVGNLQALERLAPPPHLGTHLHRLASLQASQPTLIERLEQGVGRFNFQSALAPVFAVVMALILIIYMFSWGLHRQATGRIPVHLESAQARPGVTAMESSRRVAGRVFYLLDGVWVERGLEKEVVMEQISGSDPRVQDWLAGSRELQEIVDLGDRVRVVMGDRIVEIRFDVP